DRAVGIGDQQEFRIERDFAFVQQFERFTRVRAADAYGALQLRRVERVHRLAEFQHRVLGDVHQQADRTDAAATQALAHPFRRARGGVDAFDVAPAITWAV